MPKFSHLRKYDIAGGRSARLTLAEIEGNPALDMLPATEANRNYWNAWLSARKSSAGRNRVSAETIKADREQERALVSAHCIVGWDRVLDESGKPAEFSKEAAREFFDSLPDDIFDQVRAFVNAAANFRQSTLDAEEAAKN